MLLKILRTSDDVYVAFNVYINQDLTEEESKLAYEKRVKRQQWQQNHEEEEDRNQGSSSARDNRNNESHTGEVHQIKSVIFRRNSMPCGVVKASDRTEQPVAPTAPGSSGNQPVIMPA